MREHLVHLWCSHEWSKSALWCTYSILYLIIFHPLFTEDLLLLLTLKYSIPQLQTVKGKNTDYEAQLYQRLCPINTGIASIHTHLYMYL